MGSTDNIDTNACEEWSSQQNTLGDWASLFKLSEMADSGCASKDELDELSNFATKAASHKTPKKMAQAPINIGRYNVIASAKSPAIESMGLSASNAKFARLVNSNFEKVDTQFLKLQETMGDILKRMDHMEEVSYTSIRSLEMEKERLKLEVGARSSATINEDVDAPSLWQVVSLISSLSSSSSSHPSMSRDVASCRSFETWARQWANDLNKTMSRFALDSTVVTEIESVKKLIQLQDKINNSNQESMRKRVEAMEAKIRSLEFRGSSGLNSDLLERRITALEGYDSPDRVSRMEESDWDTRVNSDWGRLGERLNAVEKSLGDINPDKESTSVRFGHVHAKNLSEMKDFLEENIPSLHFGLPADFHTVMEHINHKSNSVKPTLEHLQNSHKLDIPTTNHSLAITALETKEPKYLVKSKDYEVSKKNQSAFNKILTFNDWNKARIGHKAKMLEELTMVRRTCMQMIDEDGSMTIEGRALVTNLLSTTIAFIQNFVQFIDEVHYELIASSFTDSAAWSLATALGIRVSKDIAFPREGILNMLQMKKPIQCATLIFHTCLKCHVVMKAYEDVKFAGHPNISSEYIKFLAHNAQFEVVARMEKRLIDVEDLNKNHKKDEASKNKQLNTITQKVDNCVSKIAAVDIRLSRLEKK